MYTSTYSSSPPRASSSSVGGSTNYQSQSYHRQYYQPSTKINNNDVVDNDYNDTMDDGSMALRRGASGGYYSSTAPVTSNPIRTTTSPTRKYTSSYNSNLPYDSGSNRYQSAAHSSSYRAYGSGGDNEVFHSNISRYDAGGSTSRARSYEDLHNEQNTSHRSLHPQQSQSIYNSTGRIPSSNPYGQQQREQYNLTDDDLIVKSTDLSATHEQEMLDIVRNAFRKYELTNQRELAGFLKRAADKTFSACWHCIVGRQFSSYVTHEMNGFIYLTKGPLSILLFKSGS